MSFLLPLALSLSVFLSPFSFQDRHLAWAINQERSKSGLSILRGSAELYRVARIRSQDMCDRGYFAHFNPDGDRFLDLLDSRGYRYKRAGEIIGWTTVADATPFIVRLFMNSPFHRQAILGSWNRIGAGAVKCGDKTIVTVLFSQQLP